MKDKTIQGETEDFKMPDTVTYYMGIYRLAHSTLWMSCALGTLYESKQDVEREFVKDTSVYNSDTVDHKILTITLPRTIEEK